MIYISKNNQPELNLLNNVYKKHQFVKSNNNNNSVSCKNNLKCNNVKELNEYQINLINFDLNFVPPELNNVFYKRSHVINLKSIVVVRMNFDFCGQTALKVF